MAYFIHRKILPLIFAPFIGKVTGIENIPKNKGVILAANHSSYLDHFVIGCSVLSKANRMIFFLSKKEHFDTFFQRQWHKFLKAIPIDRSAGGKEALAEAVKYLKKNNIIMIYPEGTRTLTGRLNRAKTGVIRLALQAKVPVVPIGVTNTFRMLPKGKTIPQWGIKADVNLGTPIYFNKYYGKENNKKTLRLLTTKLMKEIGKLAKQKYEFD